MRRRVVGRRTRVPVTRSAISPLQTTGKGRGAKASQGEGKKGGRKREERVWLKGFKAGGFLRRRSRRRGKGLLPPLPCFASLRSFTQTLSSLTQRLLLSHSHPFFPSPSFPSLLSSLVLPCSLSPLRQPFLIVKVPLTAAALAAAAADFTVLVAVPTLKPLTDFRKQTASFAASRTRPSSPGRRRRLPHCTGGREVHLRRNSDSPVDGATCVPHLVLLFSSLTLAHPLISAAPASWSV